MDIIDIMLARAMTPQGKTEAYVAKAENAAQRAAAAEASATAAIATVESAADEIATAREEAAALLEEAQDALETAQSAQINTLDTEDVDDEIKKLKITYEKVKTNPLGFYTNLHITYPDGTSELIPDVIDLAKTTGPSEIEGMTQKAITEALATKADASTAATKDYVDQKVASSGGGGGSGNISGDITSDDAGHLVVVDEDGNLVPSLATDESVIEALLQAGTYIAKDAVGLDIDYSNGTFARVQEALGKSMGTDFNKYSMYGGRVKCNVADNGTITAFYGDSSYREDGTNGQVMIYQPKFYYKRVIRAAEESIRGKIVRHETLIISPTEQAGFKLAPIFEGDLDYVLLPAYDAGLADSKLTSIAGVKPINNITRDTAETYARARGTGWHIMNMAAESANQMLQMVEYGTMNGQAAIEDGITYIPANSNGQCMFITGSTAALGNSIGSATETTMDVNGTQSTVNTSGQRAINYRGMENPWGNLWSMIGGVNITGNGTKAGGEILICKDFNYSGNNYGNVGFTLPSVYGWVNAMGYGNSEYDWVYMPIECSNTANSSTPVGDGLWTVGNLNGTMILATGGSFGFKEECGPFYYAADRTLETCARNNYGVKLLYIPTKDSIYTANINKWNAHMGG